MKKKRDWSKFRFSKGTIFSPFEILGGKMITGFDKFHQGIERGLEKFYDNQETTMKTLKYYNKKKKKRK